MLPWLLRDVHNLNVRPTDTDAGHRASACNSRFEAALFVLVEAGNTVWHCQVHHDYKSSLGLRALGCVGCRLAQGEPLALQGLERILSEEIQVFLFEADKGLEYQV